MSGWVLNASSAMPFSNSLGTSAYPYVYYGDQVVAMQQGQAVVAGPTGRRLSNEPGPAPRTAASSSWNHHSTATNSVRPFQQPVHGEQLISGVPCQAAVQNATAQDPQGVKILGLEQELQAVRAQSEKQQQVGGILLSEVESLTSELAAERQRSDDLGRQLLALSAAHQALQTAHERLIMQHTVIVREHEHMTSSHSAALRELEARHADVSRLQRQLEEAQAAVTSSSTAAAAAAGGQQAGSAAPPAGPGRPRSATPPTLRPGARGGGVHLSAADEDRWALRLHKAERALEEERRVSEDLRQQLKAAESESRAIRRKLQKSEAGMESPSGGAVQPANSDPLSRSPRVLSPLSLPPPLAMATSGSLAAVGSGPQPGNLSGPPSSTKVPVLGRIGSAGSGAINATGVSAGGQEQSHAGGAKVGAPGSVFAAPATASDLSAGGGSGAGTPNLPHPHEEQVARLRQEVDGLRSDLIRLTAAEEVHRVAALAAEDRARAAELVSLDMRRQCDQAARTIGRLIDENSELVAKLNAQANALADCKSTAASKEATLRNLQSRLAQAQAQLEAAQAQPHGQPPHLPGEGSQQHHHQQPSIGLAPSPANTARLGDVALAANWSVPAPQPGLSLTPSREVLLPGSALTEADWKLVMLSEEVRRLMEEVSLSTTACQALELRSRCEQPSPEEQQLAASLDLPRILSRLEGLAGRRLGPGETAAYIIELAGHMEALEQVLQAQRRRMAALRGEQEEAGVSGKGGAADGGAASLGPASACAGDGTSTGPAQAASLQRSEQSQRDAQQQQQQASAQEEQGQNGSVHGGQGEGGERRAQELAQTHAIGEGPAAVMSAAGPLQWQETPALTAVGAEVSERVPAREAASGSFVVGSSAGAAHSGCDGAGQRRPQEQQPQSPMASAPASHHIVSPFNHLVQRKDSHAQALSPRHPGCSQQPPDSGQQPNQRQVDSGSAERAPSDPPTMDFRNTQRQDLAAAAAAAVAAVTAAADQAAAAAGAATAAPAASAAVAPAAPAAGSMGLAPMLPTYEAPPSPRAAPVVSTAAVSPAPLFGVAVGVEVSGFGGAVLDDDLLDDAAALPVKPRRPRVGLWGWISGESVR